TLQTQVRVRHKDGTWRWVEAIGTNLLDDPSVGAIAANYHDITERKQAEDALRESEERYRTLVEYASDGIFLSDAQGRYLDVNPRACDMLGYSREELLSMSIADVIAPEELAARPIRFDELRAGKALISERQLRRRDGSFLEVEISARILPDGRLQGIARDITERKRAEAALRESEDRYRDLVENSQDLICTHDLDGKLLSVNEAAVRLTGYSREALLRMDMASLLAPEVRHHFNTYLKKLRAAGRARGVMQIQTASGETRYWEYDNTLRTEGVAVPIVRGLAHDITERKRAQEERDEILEQVRAGRERLQAVSQQLLDAEEAERRRIALDLHDEVVQTLTGLRLLLQPGPGVPPERVATRMGEAQTIVEELVARVEELSLYLRPAALDDMVLLPTLLDHFERYSARTGVPWPATPASPTPSCACGPTPRTSACRWKTRARASTPPRHRRVDSPPGFPA
ncbi:MAG: PAS domain S-box protein, partial [Chloroflexi bacterium]|nr:PAS domain S-box protein [Chloroflexota bacterium]